MSYFDHLHEDSLEDYVMGRLPEQDIHSFEDHLLLCEHCQLRTREAELDWKAKRLALTRLRERPSMPVAVFQRFWGGIFGSPMARACWVVAGATTALAAFLMLPAVQQSNHLYRSVELSTMRGGAELSAPLQTNERLRLHLDLTELDQLPVYHVAVVDASGDPVWETDQRSEGRDKLPVAVSKRLVPGTYWVRLMDTTVGARRLLREYPLELR